MWQAKHISGKAVKRLLTDDEKKRWETHPATKGIYRYQQVSDPEPIVKKIIELPFEAKKYDPEKPSSKKSKE